MVVCETKPTRFMDVSAYNEAIHIECLKLGLNGCRTQTKEEHTTRRVSYPATVHLCPGRDIRVRATGNPVLMSDTTLVPRGRTMAKI
jgi:hypothetical protein